MSKQAMEMALEALTFYRSYILHETDATFGKGDAAIAALKEAIKQHDAEPVAWQPIETAPDDEPVLVYVNALDEVVRAHKDDTGKWYGHCGEKWLNGRITHWMPLPASPQPKGDE